MLPVSLEAWEALQPYQQTLITQAGFLFYFALIIFLLLKFATHSILFIGPPSIGTLFLYRSCCASCFILTQWNYVSAYTVLVLI